MTRFFYTLSLALVSAGIFAQEGLKPLRANPNYVFRDLNRSGIRKNTEIRNQHKTQATSHSLPFKEDFYYAPTSNYPDMAKWSDSSVYVNSGFAIAPPSIGVATFDGLDKHGYPYDEYQTNELMSFPADTLTSREINLLPYDASQNVGLSFYYQARGNGDNPEVTDSLLLDFFKPKQNTWKKVWYKPGNATSNTNDSVFKRGFIYIRDTSYFHDGFKFRFRNWASSTGNFDHWHLDYINLDQSRDSLADTIYNDLAIVGIPTSFLRDYSAMPYQQYNQSEMASNIGVRIRNNSSLPINMTYKYKTYDKDNNEIFPEYWGGPKDIDPFLTDGYSVYQPHAMPVVQNTFALLPDSTDYTIRHIIFQNTTNSVVPVDFTSGNDTVIQYQRFRNYYAFDDGSAEAGYYVNAVGAKIAVKINVNYTDTLRALRIYFDPAGDVGLIGGENSDYFFNMRVWGAESNGLPTHDPIASYTVNLTPEYSSKGFKQIPEFKFGTPLLLTPGTYFIGIQQKSQYITIGFDKNYNHRTSSYYDSGSGWTQSQENGSLMIRPVFGKYIPPPVGINEVSFSEKRSFVVYPNPSSEKFIIRSEAIGMNSYELFNALGQRVKQGTLENTQQEVSTADLCAGIYVLMLKTREQIVQQQKLVIQH